MTEYLSTKLLPKLFKLWKSLRDDRKQELNKLGIRIGVDWESLLPCYIQPRCQPTCIFNDEDDELWDKPSFEVLNSFLNRRITVPGTGRNVFFVLAGAGMGKSSLLSIIHYCSVMKFFPDNKRTEILKLGDTTLDDVEMIKDSPDCILLLDSLDEDPRAYGRISERLSEILS